ncbi:Phospholipid-transporting ATPase ABCA3 [Halotydeus destructor]|nr:Phospholipid-transporting ATPase ABCA3 [Halotydeus destructor]
MLWWRQVRALLWKCYIVRKRHPVTLAFEILLPLLLSSIIAWVFNSVLSRLPPGSLTPSNSTGPALTPPYIYHTPAYEFPGNILIEFNSSASQTILYAPQNKFTDQLITEVLKIVTDSVPSLSGKLKSLPFKDEPSMVDYHTKGNFSTNSLIVFHGTSDNMTESLTKLSYTLRPPMLSTPDVSLLFPYTTLGPRENTRNYCLTQTSNFIMFQALISEAFLSLKAQSVGKVANLTTWTAWKFPYPPYLELAANIPLTLLIPPLILFGFIVTFPILVKRIAEEKVNKSREMFRIMGLSDFVYWGTTFFSFYIIYLFQAVVLTFLYTHKWQGVMSLLSGADTSIVFTIFVLYGAGLMTFGMFLSIPFTKPVLAVVFAVIISTVLYTLPVTFLDPNNNPNVDPVATNIPRFLCCLFPSYSFTTVIGLIGLRSMYGMTASWSDLFDANNSLCFGSMSLGLAMVMMLLQIPLYSFLIWYLDKVWPWQDGVPKPWYFPFQVQYWKSVFSFTDKTSDTKIENLDHGSNSRYFERQLSSAPNVISIRNLRKIFGNKMAVDGVDIDVKHGEITCLLGHNGAGKTTTMSMITGLFPATEGTIVVNGYDVASQTSKARESISLCPQHNVLYDELNVFEHLKLYAAIKGLPWSECGPSAIKQAKVTQLGECLTKKPSELSGGMKRKLCLGIALVGDTQLVILDEPTSGLDPEARRMIWDVLREVRRERTILLTTHYMEEADALADSIAIMTAGKISCHGTPMYLKKVFSTGYMFRIAKGLQYDGRAVADLISLHFPKGSIRSEIDTEVIFALESEDGHTDSSKLPAFFRQLEQLKPKLGVASFGLSLTTLEDVFLKVGEMESSNEETQSHESALNFEDGANLIDHQGSQQHLDLDPGHSRPERIQGSALMYQRFKGLFLKRVNFGKRYWPMLIMQMLLPAIIFGLAMWASNYFLRKSDNQGLDVTAIRQLYGTTNGFVEESVELDSFKSVGQNQGINFHQMAPGDNVTNYLLDVAAKVGLNDYIRKNLFGATINRTGPVEKYDLWYQYEAYHAFPAIVNMFYESRLNELTSSENHIDVLNYQATSNKNDFQTLLPPAGLTAIMAILIGLSVPFLGASYVLFPIHERATQSKLLQLMTGLPVWLFWFASFLFDLISHTLASLLILIVVTAVDSNATFAHNSETLFSLLFILMLNGLATIPIAYCFSCLVKKPGTGYSLLVIVYILTGILFGIVTQILQVAVQSDAMKKTTQQIIVYLMKSSPAFSLTTGLAKVYQNGQILTLCSRMSNETLQQKCPIFGSIDACCPEEYCKRTVRGTVVDNCLPPLWSWGDQGILQEVTMIAVDFVFFGAILFLADYLITWTRKKVNKDSNATISVVQEDDVATEANRIAILVESNSHGEEALLVQNLKRSFGKSIAVDGLSFGVHKQEIFGLLGVNGAGKTTTFKILTGDILPTAGDARSGPLSIVDQRSEFQQQLGYCPQFDALLDKMTGSEMLFLFGRLRGIPEYMLRREVNQLIEMSDLTKHAHKPTETYSGGNKRKLSLAIALIGSPKLLLLDEPTSGVDPGARRKIWTTLGHIREQYGCSIILSSHSMEECEALCSRLAIMVKGQFRCLGPVQHLRNKYGQGYTVIIKIKRDRLDTSQEVQRAVQSSLRGTVLLDAHETVINYHVTDTSVTWSELFENLERIKQTFDLEDYSVSDTTLEQIFISFAKGHQLDNVVSE